MKKKFLAALLCSTIASLSLVGCGSATDDKSQGSSDVSLKVGMVTDAGTIDDKSFNQGTWTGIGHAADELGVATKYLKPAGTTHADYLKEIANLYDAGFNFIVTPGFKFETAIYEAQTKYPEAKFVLIDGEPHDGAETPTYLTADNTVSIFFAEHESGFLGGVAAAVELQEANLGFIGGMEIPPVQKFNYGFQQGVAYANENLGTNMTLTDENVLYEGTFDNVPGGTQIAATMFDSGVDAIFCAAGGVGAGAIKEATERAAGGENVWIIGVDVDQYADGFYDDAKTKSIILTSAIKRIDNAAFSMIEEELNGTFPGGEVLTLDSKNDGVGIPDENPNLSAETVAVVKDVQEKIKSGEIVVENNNDSEKYFD